MAPLLTHYSPSSHRAALARLDQTPATHRLFFALWCIDPLWRDCSETLLSRIPKSQRNTVTETWNGLWLQALGGAPCPSGREAKEALSHFQLQEDEYGGELGCASDLATLLERLASPENLTQTAIDSAITLIDNIYTSLQSTETKQRLLTSQPLTSEAQTQLVMIDYLLEAAPSAELLEAARPRQLLPEKILRIKL